MRRLLPLTFVLSTACSSYGNKVSCDMVQASDSTVNHLCIEYTHVPDDDADLFKKYGCFTANVLDPNTRDTTKYVDSCATDNIIGRCSIPFRSASAGPKGIEEVAYIYGEGGDTISSAKRECDRLMGTFEAE